jgi:hypothetical protein
MLQKFIDSSRKKGKPLMLETRTTVHYITRKLTWKYFAKAYVLNFFLVSWGGVRLGPLGTAVTVWAVIPAPDERW